MLDLRRAKRIAVIGGGIAGWFAALMLRRVFNPQVEVIVFDVLSHNAIADGEGGLVNFINGLKRASIDFDDFMQVTGASFKMGTEFSGWRNGGADDIYYHLYPAHDDHVEELDYHFHGIWPYLAMRIATQAPLDRFMPGFSLIRSGASPIEAKAVFNLHRSGVLPTLHFNRGKVIEYLKNLAQKRQITVRDQQVDDVVINEKGFATALKLQGNNDLAIDFLIDASGLKRFVIGEKFKAKWLSYSACLLQDRAVAFNTPNISRIPALVTRSLAMKAGYLWQVTLRDNISNVCIYSSKYADEAAIKQEIGQRLGTPIDKTSSLSFTPGNFEDAWVNNVVALGKSSGYIEPLEATSIGQLMLALSRLENALIDCHGIICHQTIAAFNRGNFESWMKAADFVRMHYDGGRNDSAFWRAANAAKRSIYYADMKSCFQQRLPRPIDIEAYGSSGWQSLFHIIDWLFVAAPLGIITPQAAMADLNSLTPTIRQRMEQYGREIMRQKSGHASMSGQNYHSYFQAQAQPLPWQDAARIANLSQYGFGETGETLRAKER